MRQVHLNLDDAWATDQMETVDLRHWGPRLRYHGRRADVEEFYREIEPRRAPFVLYGSGDFHYLAGVLLRRVTEPVTVISFDNHPDWDIRPPYWSCGGWVNRALELPQVRRVSIWGCGNFELKFPSRLFANRKAMRQARLEVHAWAERHSSGARKRFNCMSRQDWRERFSAFCDSLRGQNVYVTVDLDCLVSNEAITNWENGLFTADDLAWAFGRLRAKSEIAGGDLCGSYSSPTYARAFQRFAAKWDHPRLPLFDVAQSREVNEAALKKIWPALVACGTEMA